MAWNPRNQTLEAFRKGICTKCRGLILVGQTIQRSGPASWRHFEPNCEETKGMLKTVEEMKYEAEKARHVDMAVAYEGRECMFLCGRPATMIIGKIEMCDPCARKKQPSEKTIRRWIEISGRQMGEI